MVGYFGHDDGRLSVRVRTPLAVVMLGLALAGCGNSNPNEVAATTTSSAADPAPAPVTVGKDADGKDIPLRVGQGLEVRLAANPTTGFAWQLAELDQNTVKENGGAEYQQDPSPGGMAGVGGQTTWKFTATAPGATHLLLEYRRSWEQGVPAAETFALNLTVS
ncbi:protease inhibitor I42 family protein [Nocardia sp. NBC_01388]|uniref:protease inhibitor I42 family protein n=1 Tax=Nocardia sp. NBC_01388 TaxID=2903596 RepID=UPI003248B3D2